MKSRHKNNLNLEDILTDRSVEDNLIEVPLTSRVFRVFFGVTLVVALVIFVQFVNVSLVNHSIYKRSAFANIAQARIESAPRGLIKDRFGEVIVSNKPSFQVFFTPYNFPEETTEREKLFAKIDEILGVNKEELLQRIKEYDWRLGNLLLQKDISHDELIALTSEDIPGVKIEPGFSRILKDSKAFSHLIGYVGLVNKEELKRSPDLVFKNEIGKTGLEFQYDEKLRGQNGRELAFMNAQMEIKDERIITKPKIGENLNLFIDAGLQEYFYNRLLKQIEDLGVNSGAGVAINPQNGEVLALVSIPSFEVNQLTKYLDQPDHPLFDRVVKGLYSPGSTIKPLVATAALEEGIISPDKSFFSPGYLRIPNPYNPDNPTILKDWKPHGWVNIYSALARSSNVYFYIVGGGYENQPGLGINHLYKWWQKFNLNEKTGIDLPDEKTGFLPTPDWKEKRTGKPWLVGDTYNVSIGQGELLVTPLELINYISVIANGGKIYKFRLAKNQESPILIKNISSEIKNSLPYVRIGMKDAVGKSYGTAHYLANLPFEVAAKTGTTEIGKSQTNAFFVGYAPYENPEIAILVLIENATEGGLNTVPVANDIFSWYYYNRLIGK